MYQMDAYELFNMQETCFVQFLEYTSLKVTIFLPLDLILYIILYSHES